jgi:hypothetical protein
LRHPFFPVISIKMLLTLLLGTRSRGVHPLKSITRGWYYDPKVWEIVRWYIFPSNFTYRTIIKGLKSTHGINVVAAVSNERGIYLIDNVTTSLRYCSRILLVDNDGNIGVLGMVKKFRIDSVFILTKDGDAIVNNAGYDVARLNLSEMKVVYPLDTEDAPGVSIVWKIRVVDVTCADLGYDGRAVVLGTRRGRYWISPETGRHTESSNANLHVVSMCTDDDGWVHMIETRNNLETTSYEGRSSKKERGRWMFFDDEFIPSIIVSVDNIIFMADPNRDSVMYFPIHGVRETFYLHPRIGNIKFMVKGYDNTLIVSDGDTVVKVKVGGG